MQCSTTPTVWLVDDDLDDQLLIRSAFQRAQPPINILLFSDGEEFLTKLADCQQLPLLVLLDINMPRRNGFEILQALRATPALAHLPVIMLTTSSESKDRQRSFALGANQFLTRPFTIEQLENLAQELVQDWDLY